MISIAYVPDPFTYEGRVELRVEWEPGATVEHYFEQHVAQHAVRSPSLVCRRTGGIVEQSAWNTTRPIDLDDLVFLEKPEGIGEAILVGLTYLATGKVGAGLTWLGWLAATGIEVGIATGLSAILSKSLQPDLGESLIQEEPSAVYNYTGIETTARQGEPIPIVYGTHDIGGSLITLSTASNRIGFVSDFTYGAIYLEPTEFVSNTVLYMRLVLSEGEIGGLSNIRLNGNPVSNYATPAPGGGGVFPETLKGTANQDVTDLFDPSKIEQTYSVGLQLLNEQDTVGNPEPNTWVSYLTNDPIDAVAVNVLFPEGLTYNNGELAHWVWFDIRHRSAGDPPGAWSAWTQYQVTRNILQPFTLSAWYPFPSTGDWEIQVRKYTELHPAQDFIRNDIELDSVTEVLFVEGGLAYPHTAVLGFEIYATEDLQGSAIPQITATCRGRRIDRWNPDTEEWETDDDQDPAWSSNPCWIAVDYLTNPRYGMGSKYDRDTSFYKDNLVAFADWCDELVPDGEGGLEKRVEFNGVIDGGSGTIGQAVDRILAVARATRVTVGNKIVFKWERPRSITRTFNMETIRAGSFQMRYQSGATYPTRIEARYLNSNRSYEVDSAPGTDFEALAEGVPFRTETIDAFGLTKESQARRFAKYVQRLRRYVNQALTFEADARALDIEIGDVIGIAHDTPEWGSANGRVEAATTTTVTIDDDLEIEAGVTYSILVQHVDTDVLERRQLSIAPGTYSAGDTVTVDSAFDNAPLANSIYSIGPLNRETKPFVVTGIVTRQDLTRRISCVNYDERVYEDDPDPFDTITYSELPDPLATPPCIAVAPTLQAQWVNGAPAIGVSWLFTPGLTRAKVYYRRTDAPSGQWSLAAEVTGGGATITNLQKDLTYNVTVQQVSAAGASAPPGSCPISTITLTGVDVVLPAPTSLTVTPLGTEIDLEWPAVAGASHYEVRRGQHWLMSRLMGTTPGTQLTSTRFAPSGAGPGVDRFWVRPVSPAGVYGYPISADVDVPLWYGTTADLEHDAAAGGWAGTKTNCSVVSGSLVLTSAASDAVYSTGELDVGALTGSYYRLGAILWASLADSPARSTLAFAPGSVEALTQSAHGPVDPADWITGLTIEYRTAEQSIDLSSASWSNLVTSQVPAVKRYLEVRVTFNSTDSDWIPQLDELLVTAEEVT